MTPKQFVKNIILDNAFYIAQSVERKLSWTQDQINEFIKDKIEACPDCWNQNSCTECGCNAYDMFISDKPCPKGNFK